MDGNRTRVCLLKGGRTDLCATTAYIPQYSPDDEVPTPTARNHTLKKGRTPSNCRSSPLMTPIHYHNIRNIVNPIFLYLIATYATMHQNAVGDIFCSVTQLPWYPIINAAPRNTVSLLA